MTPQYKFITFYGALSSYQALWVEKQGNLFQMSAFFIKEIIKDVISHFVSPHICTGCVYITFTSIDVFSLVRITWQSFLKLSLMLNTIP